MEGFYFGAIGIRLALGFATSSSVVVLFIFRHVFSTFSSKNCVHTKFPYLPDTNCENSLMIPCMSRDGMKRITSNG